MNEGKLALIRWKVDKTNEIAEDMAKAGRTDELLWARDCKMLLDEIDRLRDGLDIIARPTPADG